MTFEPSPQQGIREDQLLLPCVGLDPCSSAQIPHLVDKALQIDEWCTGVQFKLWCIEHATTLPPFNTPTVTHWNAVEVCGAHVLQQH